KFPHFSRRLKEADYIIGPRIVIDGLAVVLPDAKYILLEDSRGNPKRHEPIQPGENLPRVSINLARVIHYSESKIDSNTIKALYNNGERSSNGIDSIFSSGLKSDYYYANPVKRSTIRIEQKELDIGGFWNSIHEPAREIDIPANMYGLGPDGGLAADIHFTPYQRSSKRYLEYRREQKLDEIKSRLNSLWTRPLNSLEEVVDRQAIYNQLIDDKRFFRQAEQLEKDINQIVEPLLHLSGMAKLISTNLLRSKWGGSIRRDLFYKDYLMLSEEFVKRYESIQKSTEGLSPDSLELAQLLAPAIACGQEGHPLRRAYEFTKSMLEKKPSNYAALREIFKKTLNASGAKLIEELEQYNRFSDGTSEAGTRLKEYRKALNRRFHSQNPISHIDSFIEYLDDAGTRLSAYIAAARVMEKEGWARPDLMPAEKGIIDIKKGYYPLTRVQHSKEIVKNDTLIDANHRVEVIEGPNIAGKTIDMRKTSLIVCLAQCGAYVPAAKGTRISFFDKIIYNLKGTGMYDSGALMSELSDIADVCQHLGKKTVFAAFDEVGTSTNEVEGEAIAYALMQRIAGSSGARAMVTSHYPNMRDILRDPEVSGIFFSHFTFEKGRTGLVFPHVKQPGVNNEGDYAIPIALDQGMHVSIINHALRHLGKPGISTDEQHPVKSSLKLRSSSNVMDDPTRDILFYSQTNYNFMSGMMKGTLDNEDVILGINPDEYFHRITTPLTDLEEINRRLDI
ncbi:MAG: hypothetical protein HGA85_08650, partial [Nanoarchaeota archaeon]|nr:hypothetical protein [Nanoarchaeota archaeon]